MYLTTSLNDEGRIDADNSNFRNEWEKELYRNTVF